MVHRHAIEFGAFWVAHIPTSVIIITTTRIFTFAPKAALCQPGKRGGRHWFGDCLSVFRLPSFVPMVVVGKGYDSEKKQNYFRFYDVGRTEESNGANTSNRLYVDKKNKKISGTYKDKVYTITEVRSNHE